MEHRDGTVKHYQLAVAPMLRGFPPLSILFLLLLPTLSKQQDPHQQLSPPQRNTSFNTKGFLTYGSACQDCGFNNQRIDLEWALLLAAATNRTLVVRNVLCSPHHSPCDWSDTPGMDGVIRVLGEERWRRTCNFPGLKCDKDHYLGKTHFVDARVFFDGDYLAQVTASRGFMWQDEFDRQYAHLQRPIGAGAQGWPIVNRRGKIDPLEFDMPVIHASHLHKGTDPTRLLSPSIALTVKRRAAKGLQPVVYSQKIWDIAKAVINSHVEPQDRFACVHARLGDWLDYDQPHLHLSQHWDGAAYAEAVLKHVHNPQTVLFVATNPESFASLEGPLRSRFRTLANSTATRQAHATRFTNDFWSCVEQCICEQAGVFVGTKGSTMSKYIFERRLARHKHSALLDIRTFRKKGE